MLAFFVKSQHDRFFESLGCRTGHISDRLAMRDSSESVPRLTEVQACIRFSLFAIAISRTFKN